MLPVGTKVKTTKAIEGIDENDVPVGAYGEIVGELRNGHQQVKVFDLGADKYMVYGVTPEQIVPANSYFKEA